MGDEPTTPPRHRRGSALAVDLRRARRALERSGQAIQSRQEPADRGPARPIINCDNREPIDCIREWFASEGWTPFAFQEEVWRAYLAGESGLVHAATGTGKTYAAWLGPVLEWLRDYPAAPRRKAGPAPLRVLWITPLRALAGDTESALRAPVEDFGLPWTVESRTGDTPARIRARQRERLPTALVTTPESLTLLLTRDDAAQLFEHLELVVVDEWHELMGSKRGVQTELALARLRRFRPALRTWGLSATMSNVAEATSTLLGHAAAKWAHIVCAPDDKPISLESVLPPTIDRFPWAGHLGLHLLEQVLARVESAG